MKLKLLLAAASLVATTSAHAADAPGCTDPAGLARFQGSTLADCQNHGFAEYALPTGKLVAFDYDLKQPRFESKTDIEGRASLNVYTAPVGRSSAEVFRNYEAELAAKGFEVLYKAKGLELGADQGRIFENRGPGEQLFGYSPEAARYLTAVKDEGTRKTYVSLYVTEYQGGVHRRIAPKMGQTLVRLDSIESGQIEDRMTVVTSAEMEKSIAETGSVSLYGILFDFNKSDVKPESRSALDEIAAYLKADPSRRLTVIGHTDSVGGADFNMRLSMARANAVVAELLAGYGIGAHRLNGQGAGLLAPVASNATGDGRARNRRVELVPM